MSEGRDVRRKIPACGGGVPSAGAADPQHRSFAHQHNGLALGTVGTDKRRCGCTWTLAPLRVRPEITRVVGAELAAGAGAREVSGAFAGLANAGLHACNKHPTPKSGTRAQDRSSEYACFADLAGGRTTELQCVTMRHASCVAKLVTFVVGGVTKLFVCLTHGPDCLYVPRHTSAFCSRWACTTSGSSCRSPCTRYCA